MNTSLRLLATALIAVLGAASTVAFAQEATVEPAHGVQSQTVQAQRPATARENTAFARAGYIEPSTAVKSREQVRAELAMARLSGEFDAINAEASSLAAPQRPASPAMAKAR